MTYLVATKAADGSKSARTFQEVREAVEFARASSGLVRIQDLVSRENWIFRDGVQLEGDEGTAALREFDAS
jgi:hypothetical protein